MVNDFTMLLPQQSRMKYDPYVNVCNVVLSIMCVQRGRGGDLLQVNEQTGQDGQQRQPAGVSGSHLTLCSSLPPPASTVGEVFAVCCNYTCGVIWPHMRNE